MFLRKLELVNFRNYESCKLEFPTKKTILVGKNAQGKTNLLESIYYLATLSSFRASSDSDLIKFGHAGLRIKAQVEKNESSTGLEVVINPPKQKILKINGVKKTSYAQFLGNLRAVSFGASDLLILRGTPSDRRRWIDGAISQLYPAYKDRLLKFGKIKTQRNNLLKTFIGNIRLSGSQEDNLSVWDDQLVVSGSNLIHLRLKYIKEIQFIACEKHKNISQGAEKLLINYNSTASGIFNSENDDLIPPEKLVELYREALAAKRKEEIIRVQTLIGPHRDDVDFFINNVDAKAFASQGQQRTVVLAIKLSELDFIRSVTGENPVLLLDDVLAELDQSRQNFLLDSIGKDIQAIITTTDIANFEKHHLEDITVYEIEYGIIHPV